MGEFLGRMDARADGGESCTQLTADQYHFAQDISKNVHRRFLMPMFLLYFVMLNKVTKPLLIRVKRRIHHESRNSTCRS